MNKASAARDGSDGVLQTGTLKTMDEQLITAATIFDEENTHLVLIQAKTADASVTFGATEAETAIGTGLLVAAGSDRTVVVPAGSYIASDVEVSVIPWTSLV